MKMAWRQVKITLPQPSIVRGSVMHTEIQFQRKRHDQLRGIDGLRRILNVDHHKSLTEIRETQLSHVSRKSVNSTSTVYGMHNCL